VCIATSCCSPSSQSNKKCCKGKNAATTLNISQRSGKYHVATGTYYTSTKSPQKLKQNATPPDSCWTDFPKIIALSVGSMLLPIGYANDLRQHHPRIKVSLNFLMVATPVETIKIRNLEIVQSYFNSGLKSTLAQLNLFMLLLSNQAIEKHRNEFLYTMKPA
jgi:hypothetical protein